ncbi:hypothetical protein PISMIDRAFT_463440 [Pisolithus microcarpus 441]|uniref:Unplaced genomic scaffold scaffold_43, whole genome shotgun sequence n=1 Tax=Pisolithus microcarpus 441 TaxID=765257 RepID=A0A0C9Z2T7_9AGAM|nr:hypothetical protein PISMIDRAFT_463440 [Pisolithus microcarpus 441]
MDLVDEKKENCFPPGYGGHAFSEIGEDVRTSKRQHTNCCTCVWNGVSIGVSMFALCYDGLKNLLDDVHVCEHTIRLSMFAFPCLLYVMIARRPCSTRHM